MPDFQAIEQSVSGQALQQKFDLEDEQITHVENLFIISYLTKALQDVLIIRAPFLQYPLLLIDLPLALAILIVNTERYFYVRFIAYVWAHIQFDIRILRLVVFNEDVSRSDTGVQESWGGKIFEGIRRFLRFSWGMIIFSLVAPIWPLLWVYNKVVQTLLIAIIYYILMGYLFPFTFMGAWLVYYLLFATVTFLVSSITVPLFFRIAIYIRELFSLESRPFYKVNQDARVAFLRFYQHVYNGGNESLGKVKPRYSQSYQAQGGVYFMVLKLLHYLKDRLWSLRERKMDVVVETIQNKTVEIVDEYYEDKINYQSTLHGLSLSDLKRTVFALGITLALSVLLVSRGANGEGILGPILRSFADQKVSLQVWVNHSVGAGGSSLGYYQHMVDSYHFLPQFLSYAAFAVDTFFYWFFQAYYFTMPRYLFFLWEYYKMIGNFLVSSMIT